MKNVLKVCVALPFLAGCMAALPDDEAGEVVEFTDTMVVIEAYGGFHRDDYRAPPSAMQEQAQRLCGTRGRSAEFLNAGLDDSAPTSVANMQYKFACV